MIFGDPGLMRRLQERIVTPTKARVADVHRKTNETDIHLSLNIDGTGQAAIDTGVGFMDHMLTLMAGHGFGNAG